MAPRKPSSKSGSGGSRSRSGSPSATRSGAARQVGQESVADQIRKVVNPLDLVVLTRGRMQEAVDDAVERGRMTRDDATALVSTLVERGMRQSDELISELESRLGRAGQASARTRKAAAAAASPDRIVREVDRARRVAGIGPNFPIVGYDDLTAAQVTARLADISPPELRKVRDYERRNANRKSVLQAIERKLA